VFQLRQGDVSLLVFVRKTPHFNLTEEVLDPKTNKFVLKLNSETSVECCIGVIGVLLIWK
jgi:vang-like